MIIEALAAYAYDALCAKLISDFELKPLEEFQEIFSAHGGYRDYPSINASTKTPLFVTWNKCDKGEQHLRGCIGTFEEIPLGQGVKEYALIAALRDHRFKPISLGELPTLQCAVTVLSQFEPVDDPLDWVVGKHGVRATFLSTNGRSYSATFLPEVAQEYGWDQNETLDYLADKAGCKRKNCSVKVTRYQGLKGAIDFMDVKGYAPDHPLVSE